MPGQRVILVGDAGFSSVSVLRQLEDWGWQYVLRQKGSSRLRGAGEVTWTRIDNLVITHFHGDHFGGIGGTGNQHASIAAGCGEQAR